MIVQKKKLKQRDRIIIVNLIIVAIIYGIYTFIISTGLNALADVDRRINDDLTMVKKLEKKSGDSESLKQSLSEAQKVIEKFSEYFIEDQVEFVTFIETSASNLGLAARLSLGEPKIEGKIKTIPLTVVTTGGYKSQQQFINEISQAKYLLNIKSLEFSSANLEAGKEPLVSLTTTINTFWKND